MHVSIDLTGRRVGRLVVLGRETGGPSWRPMWRCRCDCGWEGAKDGHSLRSERVRTCGSRACRAAYYRGGV